MFVSFSKYARDWYRPVCGLLILLNTALLWLLPFSLPVTVPSLALPLEIHNCSATVPTLVTETRRMAGANLSETRYFVFSVMHLARPVEHRHEMAEADFMLPPNPLYPDVNRCANPPPSLHESAFF